MHTSLRARGCVLTLVSLLTLAACPTNGSTDPVTTTDTTGEPATSTTGGPVTTGATSTGGPDTTTGDTGGSTAGTAITATSGGSDGSSSGGACEPADCAPCPEGCTQQEECVDGEVMCACVDCPDEIACTDDPQKFPEFDETCAATEDCALVFHQVDCCGSKQAWGINAGVAKMFGEAEAVCVMQFPQCDCAPMNPVADDGNSAEDPSAIQVECVEGVCQSYVP